MVETGLNTLPRRVARRLRRSLRSPTHIDHVIVIVCPPVADQSATLAITPATLDSIGRAKIELSRRWAAKPAGEWGRSRDRPNPAVEVRTLNSHDLSSTAGARRLHLYLVDGAALAPGALAAIVDVFNRHLGLDLLYTDADAPVASPPQGTDDEPWLLPGFSPERLADQPYLAHLVAVRAGSEPGSVPSGQLGADRPVSWFDVVRLAQGVGSVAHLPYPLHCRAPGELPTAWPSTSASTKPVSERGRSGRADGVSIIIPTRGSSRRLDRGSVVLVEQAVESIVGRTAGQAAEIVVVTTPGFPADLEARLRVAVDRVVPRSGIGPRLVVSHDDRPFNFSNVCNQGALAASGDLLVFLNDDTEVISPDWLDHLGRHARRPDVGAVGAKLLYENGTVQHCGVWSRGGHPAHRYEGAEALDDEAGYLGALDVAQNCLAVTGACLAVERHKFEKVGGFSPVFPNSYNDVDLCLKLLDRGFRTVVEPRATLFHFEASSRDPTISERDMVELHRRWRWRLNNDPYDNPNHRADRCEERPLPDAMGTSAVTDIPERAELRLWPLEPVVTSYAAIDELSLTPDGRFSG